MLIVPYSKGLREDDGIKALSTVPGMVQVVLTKGSCGYNNNITVINPGLMVLLFCPLKLNHPLRRALPVQSSPGTKLFPALPTQNRPQVPKALLGLFSLKFAQPRLYDGSLCSGQNLHLHC